MNVELIGTAQVDQVWPLIAPGFVKCLEKTPTDIGVGDFWVMCRSGAAFLIICHDGEIAASSVWQFQNGKLVCLLLDGDRSSQWTHALYDFAAQMARSNGCSELMATGRIGLGVMLKRNNVNIKTIRQTYLVEV